jgi:hypothetical protein
VSDPGFSVDHNEMASCVSRLAELREHAAGILALAEDANPEWYIWGAVGAPMAAIYWQTADDVYRHLELTGEALQDRVNALDCTAQNYQGVNDALTRSIEAIGRLLD